LGGVHYDAKPDTENKNSSNSPIDTRSLSDTFSYLPGTEKEVRDIAAMLEAQSLSTSLLTGAEAQERTLNRLASPHILHIATHGFFLPDSARGLMVEADQAMLRSGLLLAGANQSIQQAGRTAKDNDGILLAAEAAQLNLQQTQLVVLSACETGLGSTQGSEGVLGLQRAFREAGARYLIMSLWQVLDAPTQQMMSLFYQYWIADQLPIRQAFSKAQKDMQQQYAPYAWAGFVLVE
jgi:CHAT domain-containing protein